MPASVEQNHANPFHGSGQRLSMRGRDDGVTVPPEHRNRRQMRQFRGVFEERVPLPAPIDDVAHGPCERAR
jgi:hypothetical protein